MRTHFVSFRSHRMLLATAPILLWCGTGTALAQSQSDPDTPPATLPTATPPTTQGGDAQTRQADAAQTDGDETDKWKELNRHVFKGWITPIPTFDDSVLLDTGGWRSALADAGFGFTVFSVNLASYDLAQAGSAYHGAQLYNGQKFTVQTSNQTGILTYDLGKIGLDGGQLVAMGVWSTNGYQARDGTRGFRLKSAYWYQSIGHGKAELELGLLTNSNDYIGTNVGGSLSGGALGPQASIPVETGLSYAQYTAPTISLKVNWSQRLYTRTAVQRSINPSGATAENELNPIGVTVTEHDAKPLIVQEIGYRIQAAPGVKSFWFRTGALYNTSGYKSFTDDQLHNNHAFYASVDRQLTQPNSDLPGAGIYAGATFDAGAKDIDLIDRYYEARVYVKAPFASRPHDMASIVAAVNVYSQTGRVAETIGNFTPYASTQSYTASYSFRIMHGLYIQPGISAIVHPVYNRDIGTAVNGLLNIATFF